MYIPTIAKGTEGGDNIILNCFKNVQFRGYICSNRIKWISLIKTQEPSVIRCVHYSLSFLLRIKTGVKIVARFVSFFDDIPMLWLLHAMFGHLRIFRVWHKQSSLPTPLLPAIQLHISLKGKLWKSLFRLACRFLNYIWGFRDTFAFKIGIINWIHWRFSH